MHSNNHVNLIWNVFDVCVNSEKTEDFSNNINYFMEAK